MDDSGSDTPAFKSRIFERDSDTELRLQAEHDISRLQEQVDLLSKENANLRVQVDDVVKISAQLEQVHEKNKQLCTTVREVKAESESLKQRLEISLRTNADLVQKVDTEKFSSSSRRQTDYDQFQQELQKAKLQGKAQIETLYNQLQTSQTAKEELEVDYKLMANKIEKLVHNAKLFFGLSFQDVDAVIEHLGQPEITPPIAVSASEVKAPAIQRKDDSQNDKKLAVLRSKLKAAVVKVDDLEQQLTKAQRENVDLENRFTQEIEGLKSNHTREIDDQALQASSLNHQIKGLQNKVELLNKELATRKRVDVPAPVPVVQTPAPSPAPPKRTKHLRSVKTEDDEAAIQDLYQRINELTNQVRTVKGQRDAYAERLREAEVKNADLEAAFTEAKANLEGVGIIHKETVAELDTIRRAFHQKESRKEVSENTVLRREIQSQKVEIGNREKAIKSLENQVHELALVKAESARTIEQQEEKITQLKEALEQEAATSAQLQTDFAHAEEERRAKPPCGIDDVLPWALWQTSEFDPELNSQIAKIVSNPALQPLSRLQNIYRTIAVYFTQIVESRNTAIDEAYRENQAINTALTNFLVNLSIAAAVEPVTVVDFFEKKGGEYLVAVVTSLKRDADDFKRANDQLHGAFAHFQQSFGFGSEKDVSGLLQQITDLKDHVEKQENANREKNRKCHDLNRDLKSITKKAAVDADDNQSQIAFLNSTVASLKANNEDLAEVNRSLKKEIQKLQNDLRDLQQYLEDSTRELRSTHESEIESAKATLNSVEAGLQGEIAEKNAQIQDLNERLAQTTATVKLQKETISSQKGKIGEKVLELATLQAEAEEQQRNLSDRAEADKRQLISAQEKIVEELQGKAELQRKDIEKVTADLVSTQKRLKEAKTQIFELKRENQKHEKDIEAQEKQIEREKKLHDATSRATLLKAESDYTGRLEEYKAGLDREKRKVFAFIADSFKQYLTSPDSIDERAVRQVVTRAKTELSTLTEVNSAVRRIVGASSGQRTDDAVAQAFLSRG